jgi:hypothetical protein
MTNDTSYLPDDLGWLADAPLFIDADLIDRFYDAVVKPETKEGETVLQITEETIKKIEGKLNLKADMTPSGLLSLIKGIFPSIKGSVEVGGSREKSNGSSSTITLHPIHTPQRQLVQLTLHYLINLTERLFLVNRPIQTEWREVENINRVPRQLVFLNLPSQQEAITLGIPETKIIPTAAEFTNGKIELLFEKFTDAQGNPPPFYPEKGSPDEIHQKRREYWAWFDQNFSATKAMTIVEEAASKNESRISWIDYRIPISTDGETLHLHISPSGRYDTGVLAYNFVKRAYKHGLRLVGTLKSEPAMNILAIYDK